MTQSPDDGSSLKKKTIAAWVSFASAVAVGLGLSLLFLHWDWAPYVVPASSSLFLLLLGAVIALPSITTHIGRRYQILLGLCGLLAGLVGFFYDIGARRSNDIQNSQLQQKTDKLLTKADGEIDSINGLIRNTNDNLNETKATLKETNGVLAVVTHNTSQLVGLVDQQTQQKVQQQLTELDGVIRRLRDIYNERKAADNDARARSGAKPDSRGVNHDKDYRQERQSMQDYYSREAMPTLRDAADLNAKLKAELPAAKISSLGVLTNLADPDLGPDEQRTLADFALLLGIIDHLSDAQQRARVSLRPPTDQ